jgi:hypothetical protein
MAVRAETMRNHKVEAAVAELATCQYAMTWPSAIELAVDKEF